MGQDTGAPIWHSQLLSSMPGIVHGMFLRPGAAAWPAARQTVRGEQVHGCRVAWAGEQTTGLIPGVDGLVTDERHVALHAVFADCVPLFFSALDGSAVGLAHAGWRGTLAGITPVVSALFRARGWSPRAMAVAMGPSIGSCCFEVSPELLLAFIQMYGEGVASRSRTGRPSIGLATVHRLELQRIGVPSDHIEISPLCTSCHPDQLISYRRDRGTVERMNAMIMKTDR